MNEQDTIKRSAFREFACAIMRIYKQHLYPISYEDVFYQDGVRIHLLIEKYETKDDTQPVKAVR